MTLRIAEVSERTGIPATTLRYYDEIGLLPPASRQANGYRAYSERDVERLRFLTRAKRLELSLDELRVLLEAWDGDCPGTQERMSALVRRRLAEAQDRLTDLVALAAQLRTAVARLDAPARDGRCDAGCACEAALADDGPRALTLVPLGTEVSLGTQPPRGTQPPVGAEPIVCSLEAGAVPGRLDEWRAALARCTGRRQVPGGVEIEFRLHDRPGSGPAAGSAPEQAAELSRLAAAEADCCRFLEFAVLVSADLVRLRVTGPPGASDAITAVFG